MFYQRSNASCWAGEIKLITILMFLRRTQTFSHAIFLGTGCNQISLTSEPPLPISYRSSKQLSGNILQTAIISEGAENDAYSVGQGLCWRHWGKLFLSGLFFFQVHISDLCNKQEGPPSEFASANYSESWLEVEGREYFSTLLGSEINCSK